MVMKMKQKSTLRVATQHHRQQKPNHRQYYVECHGIVLAHLVAHNPLQGAVYFVDTHIVIVVNDKASSRNERWRVSSVPVAKWEKSKR